MVRDFIVENSYTFEVVFDEMEDLTKAADTAFSIRSIPTKLIIDRDGFIRFQDSGSCSVVKKIVGELETKIGLVI